MDWIERSLGIALDNGDGSLEMLVVMALAIVAGLLVSAARHQDRAWLPR